MDNSLTLEHIDPRNHPLVCGLSNDFNEVIALASYNYSKSADFVPYRVKSFAPPVNPGDECEFCVRGEWITDKFIIGEWWQLEAKRIRAEHKVIGGPPRSDWETRIKVHEDRWGCRIIVCSADGRLTKRSQAVRLCSHEKPRPMELWRLVKEPRKHCCRTHQNVSLNLRRLQK